MWTTTTVPPFKDEVASCLFRVILHSNLMTWMLGIYDSTCRVYLYHTYLYSIYSTRLHYLSSVRSWPVAAFACFRRQFTPWHSTAWLVIQATVLDCYRHAEQGR